jgi:hypothetical protein
VSSPSLVGRGGVPGASVKSPGEVTAIAVGFVLLRSPL